MKQLLAFVVKKNPVKDLCVSFLAKTEYFFSLTFNIYDKAAGFLSFNLIFFPRWDNIDGSFRKTEVRNELMPVVLRANTATIYSSYVKHDFLQPAYGYKKLPEIMLFNALHGKHVRSNS